MKYKHIIWDYNGTILDDVDLCLDILNTMLATQDAPPHDMVSYREIFGFPIVDYYTRAGFDFNKKRFELLAEEYFWPLYREGARSLNLREGIVDTLIAVIDRGITQSILSAAIQSEIVGQIKEYGIDKYFTHVSGLSDSYAHSKLKLIPAHLERIGCSIDEILFVGDTDHDTQVAKEIGCDCVLIVGGHQSKERLLATGYDVVNDDKELLKYIVQS